MLFSLHRWNKKCRARVFTIGDIVTPLNKYHTHEDIIHRKKRVSKRVMLSGHQSSESLISPEDQLEDEHSNEGSDPFSMCDKKDGCEEDGAEIYVSFDA